MGGTWKRLRHTVAPSRIEFVTVTATLTTGAILQNDDSGRLELSQKVLFNVRIG
jgi:hypothetical protein